MLLSNTARAHIRPHPQRVQSALGVGDLRASLLGQDHCEMLSGVINTAFSYITASANDTGQTTLSQSRVSCSTADDGAGKEKSTAMSTTNFTGIGRRFMLQGSRHHHEQCKGVTLEPRPQVSHRLDVGHDGTVGRGLKKAWQHPNTPWIPNTLCS